MALIQAMLLFACICAFAFAAACVGNAILRLLRVELDTDAEHLLVAGGIGVISIEMLLFGFENVQQVRTGSYVILALLCVSFVAGAGLLAPRCYRIGKSVFSFRGVDRFLLLIIGLVIVGEFLTSLAPLTGSDALHYHFTTQKRILEFGFFPDFSISHSFLCGQNHLLILVGLALHSEQLAMGLIFLGGLGTAFALGCLIVRWASRSVALAISLLFLVTPVVFWQISSSGAPDIWMAFFAGTAVLVVCQQRSRGSWQQALLAGLLAGGVAGAKYSGCFVAASLAIAIAIEYRSLLGTALFCSGSLLTGVWPYLRNFFWTGDPVFPFFMTILYPARVNPIALGNLLADTGSSHSPQFDQLVPFLFFAGMRKGAPGFWDFFGPAVLALAPLLIFARRNFRKWRIPAMVWLLSALTMFWTSGLQRFLLTVFPLALACIAVGINHAEYKDWKIVTIFSRCLIVLFCAMGLAGLAVYSREPIAAALGFVSKADYLEARSPEYQEVEAINRVVKGQGDGGKTLLFLRHTYSVDVPYVNGDPATSWMINPERLRTAGDWKEFLRQQGIAFVVRSPKYPKAIEVPLSELEANGVLTPIADLLVQDFQGKRILEHRANISVVMFTVTQLDQH